jgi:hypothetical protein
LRDNVPNQDVLFVDGIVENATKIDAAAGSDIQLTLTLLNTNDFQDIPFHMEAIPFT